MSTNAGNVEGGAGVDSGGSGHHAVSGLEAVLAKPVQIIRPGTISVDEEVAKAAIPRVFSDNFNFYFLVTDNYDIKDEDGQTPVNGWHVFAYDLDEGTLNWKTILSNEGKVIPNNVHVEQDRFNIYIAIGDKLYAIDKKDGSNPWKNFVSEFEPYGVTVCTRSDTKNGHYLGFPDRITSLHLPEPGIELVVVSGTHTNSRLYVLHKENGAIKLSTATGIEGREFPKINPG